MIYYKNWRNIAKIKDIHLKLFAILCEDRKLLSKLRKGFPSLFLKRKPQQEGPFPLTILLRIGEEGIRRDKTDQSVVQDILDEVLGFPWILCVPPSAVIDWGNRAVLPMPQELENRYTELRELYENTGSFPWFLNEIEVEGTKYYLGWVNPAGLNSDREKDFVLFPSALVNPDA